MQRIREQREAVGDNPPYDLYNGERNIEKRGPQELSTCNVGIAVVMAVVMPRMRAAAFPFVVVMLLGGCPFTMPMLMALVVMPVMVVIFVLNVRMESHSPPPFSN